ncbi:MULTISPECIES: hypothetical protein [unclassified Paenibacillus]|uniref:hypothetical protein n=1 Tax=unclassified Paenibacillus TaxID=185978 RepID=UPI00362F227A
MLDRLQTIDRLLDIAAGYYGGEANVSINEIITLIQDLSLPNLDEIDLNGLPDPPKDKFCPHNFDEHTKKAWHFRQEFFHEILGCIDYISNVDLSSAERASRKGQCVDSLIHWEESLERYGKLFRKKSFKVF